MSVLFAIAALLSLHFLPHPAPVLTVAVFHARGAGAPANVGIAAEVSVPLDAPRTRPRLIAAPVAASTDVRLDSPMAREVVAAALRAQGLDDDLAALESLRSRARWSALLPEVRLRAARSTDDSQSTTSSSSVGDDETLWGVRGRTYLEARAAFRLDRLVFAEEELVTARLRQDVRERRDRVTHRALEALFAWQRADLDARDGESEEASLRQREARAVLDVLTSGWFSRRFPARTVSRAESASTSRR
jgi:hypothetical protein